MVSKKIRLKLFINSKTNRVLYAEARKDFVDFLLNFLSLPVGGVVKVVQKDFMAGSIGNLYESMEILNKEYIQNGKKEDMLLKLAPPFDPFGPNPPRLLQNDAKGDSKKFYTCSHNHRCFTDFCGARCRQCKDAMTTECIYVAKNDASSPSVGDGGFVKDVVIFAVTDDLETKVVEVAEAELVAILEASMKSKTVLTDTFSSCGKKAA